MLNRVVERPTSGAARCAPTFHESIYTPMKVVIVLWHNFCVMNSRITYGVHSKADFVETIGAKFFVQSWMEANESLTQPLEDQQPLMDAFFPPDLGGGFLSMGLNCISLQGSSTNNLQCKYICWHANHSAL